MDNEKICCDDWNRATLPGSSYESPHHFTIYEHDGFKVIGKDLPPLNLCPWCGSPKNGFNPSIDPDLIKEKSPGRMIFTPEPPKKIGFYWILIPDSPPRFSICAIYKIEKRDEEKKEISGVLATFTECDLKNIDSWLWGDELKWPKQIDLSGLRRKMFDANN